MRGSPQCFAKFLNNTQNQLQKNEALLNRLIVKKNFYEMTEQKKRFRTIIQLGELLVASGLLEKAQILLGTDLQNDQQAKTNADKLLQFLKDKCDEFDLSSI